MIHFWQQYLGPLIRSNFFVVVATFAAGYIALRVYSKQKRDEKRNAASIILLEIESAESGLKKVNVDKPFPDLGGESAVVLMQESSWNKYKHLFVSDFLAHRNEWDKITDFYGQCAEYDSAAAAQSAMIDANTRAIATSAQDLLSRLVPEHSKDLLAEGNNPEARATLELKYMAARSQIIETMTGSATYIAPIYHYIPVKFSNIAKRILRDIDGNLSTSSSGDRLRELAIPKSGLYEAISKAFKEWRRT